MKIRPIYFLLLFAAALMWSCDNDSDGRPCPDGSGTVPEGYFEVVFSAQRETRAAVSGQDSRVQHLRYIIYEKTTGQFVREKVVFGPSDGIQTWPIKNISEVLPYGQYRVVFIANADKSLFGANQTTDILTDYGAAYADARINLPDGEFSADNMLYMAAVDVDPDNANPYILLQRIVNQNKVKRELVAKADYLQNLAEAIFDTISGDGGVLRVSVTGLVQRLIGSLAYVGDNNSGILGGLLGNLPLLGPLVTGLESTLISTLNGISSMVGLTNFAGGLLSDNILLNLANLMAQNLDKIVGQILTAIRTTVVNAILERLEDILSTNVNTADGHSGILSQEIASLTGGNTILGGLLNPWKTAGHDRAFVTVNQLPKSVGFDLLAKELFADGTILEYAMTEQSDWAEKYFMIYTLPGSYTVTKIDMRQKGLLGGVVVSGVVEDALLGPSVVDIETPFSLAVRGNESFSSIFGTIRLRVNDQNDLDETPGNTLSVNVNLTSILKTLGIWTQGQNGLVSGLLGVTLTNLGTVVNRVTSALGLGTLDSLSVPVQLPILNETNLTLESGWQVKNNYSNN